MLHWETQLCAVADPSEWPADSWLLDPLSAFRPHCRLHGGWEFVQQATITDPSRHAPHPARNLCGSHCVVSEHEARAYYVLCAALLQYDT
eukprot:scaffold135_cov19-Tisochrysis_lutea.AAC.7